MALGSKITAVARKQLSNIKTMYDRRLAAAEARAKQDVAKAKTKADRQKAMLKLQREKADLKRELYEAKIATQKAKVAAEKARKEAGDLTISERLGKAISGWQRSGRYHKRSTKSRRR